MSGRPDRDEKTEQGGGRPTAKPRRARLAKTALARKWCRNLLKSLDSRAEMVWPRKLRTTRSGGGAVFVLGGVPFTYTRHVGEEYDPLRLIGYGRCNSFAGLPRREGAGADGNQLVRCSRLEMLPQRLEKTHSAPGNGARVTPPPEGRKVRPMASSQPGSGRSRSLFPAYGVAGFANPNQEKAIPKPVSRRRRRASHVTPAKMGPDRQPQVLQPVGWASSTQTLRATGIRPRPSRIGRPQAVAGRSPGQGAISGRGSSLSKDLRRHFRATVGASGTRALMRRPGSIRGSSPGTAGSRHRRVRALGQALLPRSSSPGRRRGNGARISGRGFNLFNPLRRHFRADSQPPVHHPGGRVAERGRGVEVARVESTVEPVGDIEQKWNGLRVVIRGAARDQTQRRFEANRARLAIGRGLSGRGRATHDPPHPFARRAPCDVPIARALPQAGDEALEAQRAGRRARAPRNGVWRSWGQLAELRTNIELSPAFVKKFHRSRSGQNLNR